MKFLLLKVVICITAKVFSYIFFHQKYGMKTCSYYLTCQYTAGKFQGQLIKKVGRENDPKKMVYKLIEDDFLSCIEG